ncbi:MAG: ATP-binding cassette domain-containing protein, partial [Kiritimatiellae bacterium]|nr:ATP-binding cassette domain-containing protein [Kiritimatiellia bacterium]
VSHASFEIAKGKMVAVVGGTGSGKSTLSGLLCRFFDPQSGSIRMDGVDLREMRTADLRGLIGSVQQETLLFNESIEANISYGSPGATHEQVVAAAKMANAHEFIMSQPGGYDRVVGEKGFSLSGGERQRIAIARAILRNPPILILDEATSALDTVTEKLVQDAINNLMANRTTFAIAHRLSTIRGADLILVMDQGRIMERGTHDELYAAGGVYRKLCDMQATA